jgi:hypothetical protein
MADNLAGLSIPISLYHTAQFYNMISGMTDFQPRASEKRVIFHHKISTSMTRNAFMRIEVSVSFNLFFDGFGFDPVVVVEADQVFDFFA